MTSQERRRKRRPQPPGGDNIEHVRGRKRCHEQTILRFLRKTLKKKEIKKFWGRSESSLVAGQGSCKKKCIEY